MKTLTDTPEERTATPELHCYAACRPDLAIAGLTGVAGTAVEVLAEGPVAVLASPLPPGAELDNEESLAAHARVVQQAFEAGVVVPLRFPTVAPSRHELRDQFLQPLRRSILRALDRLDGHEEVRVRLRYDEDRAVAEVVAGVPRLARLRGRSDTALALGEAIVAELRHRAGREAGAALKVLRPLCADLEVDALGGEHDVLVASALVKRGATDRIAQALQRWAGSRPAVELQVTGPLPPYSFAELG